MIGKHLANKIKQVKGISERVAILKLDLGNKDTLTIIQVYAPTLGAESAETEAFYNLLEDTYKKEKGFYTIVMGDFNAKFGENLSLKNFLGRYVE